MLCSAPLGVAIGSAVVLLTRHHCITHAVLKGHLRIPVFDIGLQTLAALQLQKFHVHLNSCNHVTDTGLVSISALLQLQTLVGLGSCPEITNIGLRSVALLLDLQYNFDLCYCHGVTNAGLGEEPSRTAGTLAS